MGGMGASGPGKVVTSPYSNDAANPSPYGNTPSPYSSGSGAATPYGNNNPYSSGVYGASNPYASAPNPYASAPNDPGAGAGGGYQDPNAQYQDPDAHAQEQYPQEGYDQGPYAQDQYGQDQYGQEQYAQEGDDQGQYAQDQYAQEGYDQGQFPQEGYEQGTEGGAYPPQDEYYQDQQYDQEAYPAEGDAAYDSPEGYEPAPADGYGAPVADGYSEEPTADEESAAEPSSGSSLGLIVLIALLMTAVGGGGLTGYYYFVWLPSQEAPGNGTPGNGGKIEIVDANTTVKAPVVPLLPPDEVAMLDLLEGLKTPHRETRHKAAEEMAKFKEKAIPHLLTALDDRNLDTRAAAAESVSLIESGMEKTIPALVKCLGLANDSLQVKSILALEKIGPASVPPIITALEQAVTSNDRKPLIIALARPNLAPHAHDAMPILLESLGDADPSIRSNSALVLQQLGDESVPGLVDVGRQGNAIGKFEAVRLLGIIRAPSPQAITLLTTLLSDAKLQKTAQQSLISIGKDTIPELMKVLSVPEGEAADLAAKALGTFKTPPALGLAVSSLIQGLGSDNIQVRYRSAQALAAIGPPAADALPALRLAANDMDRTVRYYANDALTKINR